MTAQTAIRLRNEESGFKLTRRRVLAIVLLLWGLLIFRHGLQFLQPGDTTTLTLAPGPIASVPHVVIPTQAYFILAGILTIAGALGGLFAPENLRRWATIVMIVAGILIIPTIIIGVTVNASTNIATIFRETLRLAVPIAIGGMAGLWCERCGIINIAIEGMMLFGACFGFVAVFTLRQMVPSDQMGSVFLVGVLVAIGVGGLAALLHGWLSITFSTNQIVSGTVINILAVGVTSFVRREYLLSTDAGAGTLPAIAIPVLSDIPVIGPLLFNNPPIFYMMFIVLFGTQIILFQTRWGLRMRAVGENPHAADTLGINVNRTRWICVVVSGCLAGMAGAWFSLEATGRFNDGMTRGAGFIALAALIFGKWNPIGVLGAALLFGFSDALGTRLQIMSVPVPHQFLQMVPYFVTIVVLAGLVGRAMAPKAVGEPYKKE